MASTAPDLQTELRKRARRRLLGAIALALTAAIVLPVVMDHEPRAPAQDIAVRIPPRDSLPALAQPVRPEPADTDVMIPPAPPDTESTAPATTGAAPVAPPTPPAPVPVPPKSEPPKPAAAPAAASEASRVAALLDGKSGAFALQLGVFSDAANVAKLRARAKELGFPTFTEPVKLENGQSRTRVKVGPFPTRAAAEAAQRKLEGAGMRSMVAPAA
ncbi:SPOR domain-containing protein [Methyloversatilis sp. XJ19-13]|uniref:SPOR domain-containing protein n=1 Tax=Methyloversatilis sp. XJ19-13 TaxID=2963430 RepID=UPI00211C6989|nr:SPOR domain-containing protein [Methyloversatilis sp. XJ19-13]